MASVWDNPETEAQTLLGLALLRAGRVRSDAEDLASGRETETAMLEPAAPEPLAAGSTRRRLEPRSSK